MTSPSTAVAVRAADPAPVMTFPQKLAYCEELSKSGLLPEAFRRQPASVLWALEYGEAVGLRGVVAMSSIHVIQGRPAPSAAMAAGLIRSKGHVLRVYTTPPTPEHRWGTAVAELIRKDDTGFTFRAEWSVEDAVAAEIITIGPDGAIRPNGRMGTNWPKYPRQMMKARALGEVCRDGATDVLMGLHYLAEELDDAELDDNGQVRSTGRAPTVDVSTREPDARPVTVHAAHAERVDTGADDGPVYTEQPSEPPPLSAATRRAMMALMRHADIGGGSTEDKAKRLRVAQIVTRKSITRSEELTEDDGQAIVTALRNAGDNVAAYVANLLAGDDQLSGETTPDAPDTTDQSTV